jgi:TatD DNase family protein
MNFIDTHCHLTFVLRNSGSFATATEKGFEQFGDTAAVIQRSREAGITGWVTVGTDLQDSTKAVELAERFKNMFAAVAIHPHEARTADDKTLGELKQLAKNKKVVAIGETGLDYHYDFSTPQQQRDCFERHLEIAAELNLPVIIHCREALDDTVKILESNSEGVRKVVFHCFSGSVEQAKVVLEKGWCISLTGVVTFRNAEKTREVAKFVPIERLMIETDSPYMSPEPMRKQKVNEPALLVHTARFIADLKGMELVKFAEQVTATTKQFFTLPDLV